jgi:formate C-acetyltransferase
VFLTGYFNLPKLLKITLNNGIDPQSGKRLGPETGDPAGFETYDELAAAFIKQVKYFLDIKMQGNDLIEALFAKYMPVPFLSLRIDDCIARILSGRASLEATPALL